MRQPDLRYECSAILVGNYGRWIQTVCVFLRSLRTSMLNGIGAVVYEIRYVLHVMRNILVV